MFERGFFLWGEILFAMNRSMLDSLNVKGINVARNAAAEVGK